MLPEQDELEEDIVETVVNDFENKFLISTSTSDGSFFERSVVYIFNHTPEFTTGLIINQPMIEISFAEIISQIVDPEFDVNIKDIKKHPPIYAGGPVEIEQGFILHSPEFSIDTTVQISDEISLTATLDAVKAIATGRAPRKFLICMGYSGWSPMQIEQEVVEDGWLVAPASADILFDTPAEERYQKALDSIGLTDMQFISPAGDA